MRLPAIPVLSALSTAGRIAVAAVLLVAILLAWWFVTEPGRQHQRAAEARTDSAIASGQAAAAKDATGVVVSNQAAEAATDAITRSNRDEIMAASGAHAAVDPGVADAGRRALCLRGAYHASAACQRLLKPGP